MKYLVPINISNGTIDESIMSFFLKRGTAMFKAYPQEIEREIMLADGSLGKELNTIDYSYDTVHRYVPLPDNDKITPYTELYYDTATNEWIYTESVELAKQKKLQELSAYDSSTSVNIFTIYGASLWLSKSERLSISNLANARKNMGKTDIDINLKGSFLTLPIDTVIYMLQAIEVYAGDCYNSTQKHIETINSLQTIEAVEGYDFTTNYPEKLVF